MKKSEFLQRLIEIEKEKKENTTITMPYINYLEEQKKLVEIGDVELK